jgi:hypothetical protein
MLMNFRRMSKLVGLITIDMTKKELVPTRIATQSYQCLDVTEFIKDHEFKVTKAFVRTYKMI